MPCVSMDAWRLLETYEKEVLSKEPPAFEFAVVVYSLSRPTAARQRPRPPPDKGVIAKVKERVVDCDETSWLKSGAS